MSFPSRIQGSGNSGLSATNIVGDTATGLVAVGSTAATALQLSAVHNAITTSAVSTGVRLPPTEAGAMVTVRNDSGQTISIYPYNTNSTINGTTSVTVVTAKTILLIATSATTWVSLTGA